MSTSVKALTLAAMAGAALVLAACGQAGAPTGAAGATQAAVATQAATQAPGATAGPGLSFVLPNEDKDLEALLPDQIGGKPVQKLSMAGTSFLVGGGSSSDDFTKILTQFGKSPADLSVAVGGTDSIQLGAFRVKGVDANQLFQSFLQLASSAQGDVVSDANVGGKSVKKVVTVDGDVSYIYASGDVLFTVDSTSDTDPALVTEAFSKLR
jgi:hypothetical protein